MNELEWQTVDRWTTHSVCGVYVIQRFVPGDHEVIDPDWIPPRPRFRCISQRPPAGADWRSGWLTVIAVADRLEEAKAACNSREIHLPDQPKEIAQCSR